MSEDIVEQLRDLDNDLSHEGRIEIAAAIEALRAERDKYRSDLAKADQALRDGLLDQKLAEVNYALNMENDALRAERDAYRRVNVDLMERSLTAEANRDAALAREKGLREALTGILDEEELDGAWVIARTALAAQEADRA